MILCGWCDNATLPGLCSNCGRNPIIPWEQRNQEPPSAEESREAGRPPLNATQIRTKIRSARKELGEGATNAELAELLGISERQLGRWLRAG